MFWAVLSYISAIRALLYGHITGKKVANGGRHHWKSFRASGDSENLNFQILTTSFERVPHPRNPCFGVFWAVLSYISAIRALLYGHITGKKVATGGRYHLKAFRALVDSENLNFRILTTSCGRVPHTVLGCFELF